MVLMRVIRFCDHFTSSGKLHNMLREVIAHQVTSRFAGAGKHIVRYSAAWVEDNHLYIQMEFCDDGSIDDLLRRRKWVQQGSVYVRPKGAEAIYSNEQLDIFRHVAEGLRCLHDPIIGLVHLDIKPANIFIKPERSFDVDSLTTVPSGKSKVYKIGDLGLAAHTDTPSEAEHGDGVYVSQEMLNDVGGTCDHSWPEDEFCLPRPATLGIKASKRANRSQQGRRCRCRACFLLLCLPGRDQRNPDQSRHFLPRRHDVPDLQRPEHPGKR